MSLRRRMENDLDRDIRDHIEMETHENIERGMSPEEARHAAVRKFGNVLRVTEETRAVWHWAWVERMAPGRALRIARPPPQPRFRRRCDCYSGARRRHEYGCVQRGQRSPDQAAAIPRCRAPGVLFNKRRNVFRILYEVVETRQIVWVVRIRHAALGDLGPG